MKREGGVADFFVFIDGAMLVILCMFFGSYVEGSDCTAYVELRAFVAGDLVDSVLCVACFIVFDGAIG